jgi:hypothetical protein
MYMDLPDFRDLTQAEHWYQRGLELRDERDRLGRAKCLIELGLIAWHRLKEAREANEPEETLRNHFKQAEALHQRALSLLPPYAYGDLSAAYHHLGCMYAEKGDLKSALPYLTKAIRCAEEEDDHYIAADIRSDVALYLYLYDEGRLADARDYAYAALHNYETYGDRAAPKVQKTQELISWIEQKLHIQGDL